MQSGNKEPSLLLALSGVPTTDRDKYPKTRTLVYHESYGRPGFLSYPNHLFYSVFWLGGPWFCRTGGLDAQNSGLEAVFEPNLLKTRVLSTSNWSSTSQVAPDPLFYCLCCVGGPWFWRIGDILPTRRRLLSGGPNGSS